MRIFLIPLSRTTKVMHCHSTLLPSSTSYLNRATNFASKKWERLSQAPPDGVKRKLYSAGSKILERIEHQEVFLKEVPAKEDIPDTTSKTMVSDPDFLSISYCQIRMSVSDIVLIEASLVIHRSVGSLRIPLRAEGGPSPSRVCSVY